MPTNESKPLCYSYIRFSTPQQANGDSLRRQREAFEKYAKDRGLEIDTSLTINDLGLSGFDGSNIDKGGLGRFLTAIKEGKVEHGSVLVVESLDRISRQNVLEAFKVFTSILDAGVNIATLVDGKEHSKESISSSIGDLFVTLGVLARANEESETKSKRLKASWLNKRNNLDSKILTSKCPAWLRPNKNKNGFDQIDNRFDLVKRV